jgi:anti-sigma factor RsiW
MAGPTRHGAVRVLDCVTARGMLCDLVDGELSAELSAALDEHVRACSSCPTLSVALVAVCDQLSRLRVPGEPLADAAEVRRRVLAVLCPPPGGRAVSWSGRKAEATPSRAR